MTDAKNQIADTAEQIEKKQRKSRKGKQVEIITDNTPVKSIADEIVAVTNAEVDIQPAPKAVVYDTGEVFETELSLLYISSVAPMHFRGIKGKFYIWSNEIVNGRIRLTDSLYGVGKVERIIGWVKVPNKEG